MTTHRRTSTKTELIEVDGLKLPLQRFERAGSGRSVLLLHGGNTNSKLYHEPDGGLVAHLLDAGCDVWTLDWRASSIVLEELMGPRSRPPRKLSAQEAERERAMYTLDRVAEADIPLAIARMRSAGVEGNISVLGFCLAGCALSMSVARGHLEGLGVSNVVLVTVGLFCEVPWNGWAKAEDYIIERVLADDPTVRAVDPIAPQRWPRALAEAYERWPKSWLGTGDEPIDELFRRLTFMYGEPYARPRLTRRFERGLLAGFFGPVHLGLFLHGSQIVRRGYAARFDALDVIDRTRIEKANQQVHGSDLVATHFRNKRVTAITGADDRLWHRDSVDLTYEWLRNEAQDPHGDPRRERARHRKHVVPHYGHLDIFWSEDAKRELYPLFELALTQAPVEEPLIPLRSRPQAVESLVSDSLVTG